MFQLRPYQVSALRDLFKYITEKPGNPIVSACVGSGKSLLMAEFCRGLATQYPQCRILMLTHVKELIEQNYEKLKTQYPEADAGIYSASIGRKQHANQITYAGIQSVFKRYNQIGHRDFILIDECHLLSPNEASRYQTFIKVMKEFNPALRVIGFTGTPFRTNDGMLTDGENAIFDEICHEVGMGELIKLGYLCPLVSKTSKVQADLSGVHTRGGEYIASEMQKTMDNADLTEAAIKEVEHWANDRRTGLFFCAGVEHAMHVRDALRLRGYSCEMVTGKTPKKEREAILKRFKAGDLRYITNDSVMTTGTDVPNLDLIVMLRGTKSPGLYIQILGRGVRTLGADISESIQNGKTNCMVLDFAGNIERFGPVDKIEINSKRKGKKDGISIQPVKTCDRCREPNHISAANCVYCGFAFPPPDRINHDRIAYDGAILSGDIKDKRHTVTNVTYSRHKKKDKPDSLRVTYFNGIKTIHREWVCIEHGQFPRAKAEQWWKLHSDEPAPKTVTEALYVSGSLRKPNAIWLKSVGKYKEVTKYEFE